MCCHDVLLRWFMPMARQAEYGCEQEPVGQNVGQ